MDVMDAILGRRSVRDFLPDAPKQEVVTRLIEAATHAPSAVNEQPWSFVVVRGRGVLDRISNAAKDHMARLKPLALPESLYEKLRDPAFDLFYKAPLLIVICARADGPWTREDCALAAQNLMLAAHGLGLGSCWIGLSQAWINTPEGKRMLGIPESDVAIAPIVVGHPRAAAPPLEHKPPRIAWIS